jgi:hypothetical protein
VSTFNFRDSSGASGSDRSGVPSEPRIDEPLTVRERGRTRGLTRAGTVRSRKRTRGLTRAVRTPEQETAPSPDKETKTPDPGTLPTEQTAGREVGSSERTEKIEAEERKLAAAEGQGMIEGTFKAFGQWLVQVFADAHGFGPLLRIVRWTAKAAQWMRVAEGEGGVDISMPIPIGSGVDFQMSAHMVSGSDSHNLPFTVCFAPSDDSPVGALQFGQFTIDPEPEDASQTSRTGSEPSRLPDKGLDHLFPPIAAEAPASTHRKTLSAEHNRAAKVVEVDLSGVQQVSSPQKRVATLKHAAEEQLLPRFRAQYPVLGEEFIVGCDFRSGLLIWVRLDEWDQYYSPTWRIEAEVDATTGQLIRLGVGHIDVRRATNTDTGVTGSGVVFRAGGASAHDRVGHTLRDRDGLWRG